MHRSVSMPSTPRARSPAPSGDSSSSEGMDGGSSSSKGSFSRMDALGAGRDYAENRLGPQGLVVQHDDS